MLKGVIFDFDGTLFNSMFVWEAVGETYLRSLGKEPEEGLRKVLKNMSLQQSAAYLQEHYQLKLSVEEICAGINRTVESFYFHTVQPKPGVMELLEEMKQRNITMCIATATDRYQVEAALRRCGMSHFFSAIFTCTEVGSGKDSPEIFQKAMEHLQTDRSNTAVVEDAYYAIQTARKDGFKIVGVYDLYESNQKEVVELSDVYLPDYLDLTLFYKFAAAE